MTKQLQLKAPAKVNRFLHITGQRPDGYHLLQTVFQLIDLEDHVTIDCRLDGAIVRTNGPSNVKPEDDLVIRAAQLLKETSKTALGCNIHLEKNIPMGAGLGGGSSDAATVLWGLNELWNTRLTRQELMNLGVRLGADVPFTISGGTAIGTGKGEQITPVLARGSYSWVLAMSSSGLSTPAVYNECDRLREGLQVSPPHISDTLLQALSAGIDPTTRGESLAVERFAAIAKQLDRR